jgi:hypothetical protein
MDMAGVRLDEENISCLLAVVPDERDSKWRKASSAASTHLSLPMVNDK